MARLPSSLLLFVVACFATQQSLAFDSAQPDIKERLGNGFTISQVSDQLVVEQDGSPVWSTVPGKPFISASAGNDSFTGSNGAFNITVVDFNRCKDQTISSVANVPWNGTVTGSAVQVAGELRSCGDATAPYTLTFWIPDDLSDRVAFYADISQSSDSTNALRKLYLSFASHSDEDFYGLGAQGSFASLKGQSFPIFSREQGVGRGDQPITGIENENGSFSGGDRFTTYTAIPSYISTDGSVFYLSAKSTGYANFDFTEQNAVTMRYDSLSVDGAFMGAQDMFGAVEMLTAYTGRQPHLPEWVDDGAILGIQGGQDKVNEIIEQGLQIGCPIAGVWLQDWVGTHSQEGPYLNISRLWWNWENDESLYPDWNSFVQDLRSNYNIRTLSYINTFLTNVSTKSTGFRRNLYDEADALHYFVQNTTTNGTAIISSGPGLEAGIIDLTKAELVNWFTDIMRSQVWNANISGYMSDFGEYTPVTSDTALGNMVSDAFFFHNQYPTLWAVFQRQLVQDLNVADDAVIFHRSASMESNRYMNLFWVGDQNVDWGANDGLKSVIPIMAHMGLSGYSQQHSDVGGYTTVLTYEDYNVTRSPELLGRWGELAAVSSAVFRSHEGNVPEVNAQFYSNGSTYAWYAYNARMFAALGPYRRKVLAAECENKGWPLLRPAVMYHTQDMRARAIKYESFYLGSSLYVAPVLDAGVSEVQVYLPGEDWEYRHVWSNATYSGGQDVRVAAPYGKPAVFVVVGKEGPELDTFMEFVREENGTQIKSD